MFSTFTYIANSDKLESHEHMIFNKYLVREIDKADIEFAFGFLCEMLFKHHNQKVVILIDEYDTPLNEAYTLGYTDELTRLIRNLMTNAFKDNPYLFKGVLTGITRISKDSMLSGLNNLQVYSIFNDEYKQYFGFTDVELDDLFYEQGMDRQEQMVKEWYNGYNFAGLT